MTYRGFATDPPTSSPASTVANPSTRPNITSAPLLLRNGGERYAWLNGIVTVSIGSRHTDGPVYSIFEVL